MRVCAYMRMWQRKAPEPAHKSLVYHIEVKQHWSRRKCRKAPEQVPDESIDKIDKCIEYICS